jgi:hypothetical protein
MFLVLERLKTRSGGRQTFDGWESRQVEHQNYY